MSERDVSVHEDIVVRLRQPYREAIHGDASAREIEAADIIESLRKEYVDMAQNFADTAAEVAVLRAERDRLREALTKIAESDYVNRQATILQRIARSALPPSTEPTTGAKDG